MTIKLQKTKCSNASIFAIYVIREKKDTKVFVYIKIRFKIKY